MFSVHVECMQARVCRLVGDAVFVVGMLVFVQKNLCCIQNTSTHP